MIHQPMANKTWVSELILLGFPGLNETFDVPIYIGLFLAYIISLRKRYMILLIAFNSHLNQPMYKIMYWFGAGSIPYCVCILQLFCVHFLRSFDAYIIIIMALDRYIAICYPLRYACILTNRTTCILSYFFWISAGAIGAVIAILDSTVPICNKNKILLVFLHQYRPHCIIVHGHYLCETTGVRPGHAICSRDHFENWRKTFYTCATHLLAIGFFFIPRIFVYVSNQVQLILEEYLNVLHMANPVIYCLRTIGRFFRKIISKVKNPISVSVIVN
ncbi:hypothetical protein XELAEV_18027645mg [Xenopus laevis]|uniref:G-protein coupled receptors family 1 profile domain-containing protein n=1 Tax=Xenopus laevis TaxID=8355 RepID=A0A974CWS0_XENLA|nr:hypothetical protein XELAEV_18027645mg [Xenopus laevis]